MKVSAFLLVFLLSEMNNWVEPQADRYDNEEVAQILCFSETMSSGKSRITVCHVGVEVKTKSGNK
jgi:hypothetical protein